MDRLNKWYVCECLLLSYRSPETVDIIPRFIFLPTVPLNAVLYHDAQCIISTV